MSVWIVVPQFTRRILAALNEVRAGEPPDAARSNSSALLLIPLPGEVKELEAKLL